MKIDPIDYITTAMKNSGLIENLEEILQSHLDTNGCKGYRVLIDISGPCIQDTETEEMKELSDMIDDMWGSDSDEN